MKYYRLLGVDRFATIEEIKNAYKKLAMIYHPDRNIGKEEEAEAKFKEIRAAYDVLMERRNMFTPNLTSLRSK
jgi:DnaJ-class molecular chaperone